MGLLIFMARVQFLDLYWQKLHLKLLHSLFSLKQNITLLSLSGNRKDPKFVKKD